MTKITIEFAPIRSLLGDPELNKFKKLLGEPDSVMESFLDALDRPDVLMGMILAPVFSVPGIVPACITLKGDKDFEASIQGNDFLKKCLGAVIKVRAKSLGLAPSRRKGRVGHWMPGITVGEVYQPTSAIWSVITFEPTLPDGSNIFGIPCQERDGEV